jgi:hypothetical protein
VRGNSSYFSDSAKEISRYSLWQSLLIASSLLTLSIVIAAVPAWANERRNASGTESPAATASKSINSDIETVTPVTEISPLLTQILDQNPVLPLAVEPIAQPFDRPLDRVVEKPNDVSPANETSVTPAPPAQMTTTPEIAPADTSGTNPAVLIRTLTLSNEYLRLPTGNYSNITNFRFAEPFADGRMNIRFTVPVVATDVLGDGNFGLGDIGVKWNWVADLNAKTALLFSTELIAPTASKNVLGTGKWVLAPAVTYAFFVNKNIIVAPAYIHNFSIAGDGNRENVHRGDFDLYVVYTSDDKSWWLTSDLTLSLNYQNGKLPASWEVQYGLNLAKLPGGGALNAYIKPGIGIGGDRFYDWNLEVGISIIGF